MKVAVKGVTSGAFVREVWLGGVPVREVWYEGVKLYPDGRTVVKDICFGVPEGDVWWDHARHAALAGEGKVVVVVGGKRYHLWRGDGSLPVLREVGGVFRAEVGMGVLLQDVADGIVARVEADVKERRPYAAQERREVGTRRKVYYELPWLPGTRVGGDVSKGRKKVSAHLYFEVGTGDVLHLKGDVLIPGHGRGDYTWSARADGGEYTVHSGSVQEKSNGVGEYGVRMWGEVWTDNGTPGTMQVVYPAFRRVWSLDVLGATLW